MGSTGRVEFVQTAEEGSTLGGAGSKGRVDFGGCTRSDRVAEGSSGRGVYCNRRGTYFGS